jgi:hypothetical protein
MIVYPFPQESKTLTYLSHTTNAAGQTSYTFSSVAIGGPGLIAIVVHAEASVGRTFSSATIGGLSASIAVNFSQLSSPGPGSITTAIIYRRITAGTTANVILTFSGAMSRCSIGAWRINGNASDTPRQTQSTFRAGAGTTLSLAFTSQLYGALMICGQTNGTNTTPMTWTNATERYDVDFASLTQVSGADFSPLLLGSRTITTTYASSAQAQVLVGATWF